MFLSSYTFEGDPTALVAGYERMRAAFPADALELQVCVSTDSGLVVYDACPDREAFEAFSTSEDLAAALSAAGLPSPRIEPLGDVHAAILRETVPS